MRKNVHINTLTTMQMKNNVEQNRTEFDFRMQTKENKRKSKCSKNVPHQQKLTDRKSFFLTFVVCRIASMEYICSLCISVSPKPEQYAFVIAHWWNENQSFS